MKLYKGFSKSRFQQIAKRADNKQVLKDVQYAAFIHFHTPEKIYAESTDDAFIVGCYNRNHLRIIGMGTAVEQQGKGLATMLLNRAILAAKERGFSKVKTRSLSGVQFYAKRGFDVVGIKGGDYLLEYEIK